MTSLIARRLAVATFASIAVTSVQRARSTRRGRSRIADMQRLLTVSDPAISPSGDWIAYTVTGTDTAHDRADGRHLARAVGRHARACA